MSLIAYQRSGLDYKDFQPFIDLTSWTVDCNIFLGDPHDTLTHGLSGFIFDVVIRLDYPQIHPNKDIVVNYLGHEESILERDLFLLVESVEAEAYRRIGVGIGMEFHHQGVQAKFGRGVDVVDVLRTMRCKDDWHIRTLRLV